MIELNFVTIIGLVGVTLVLAVGKIFETPREWLKGFTHRWNPLRWIGDGMSCTMCAGWWVGFGWGLYSGRDVVESAVTGGLVSVAAFISDEVLAIVAAVSIRLVRRPPPTSAAPVPHVIRPQIAPEDKALSEDEAHTIADDEEDHADQRPGRAA